MGGRTVEESQRGQAVPLVIGTAAVMIALLLGVAHLAGGVIDAARARTAADAAALAGAVGGRSAADDLAARNGGEVVEFADFGDDVVVEVRVGRAVATARATASRGPVLYTPERDDHQPAG